MVNNFQDDLWRTITEVAHSRNMLDKNLTIKEIMDTWTVQVSYKLGDSLKGARYVPLLLPPLQGPGFRN